MVYYFDFTYAKFLLNNYLADKYVEHDVSAISAIIIGYIRDTISSTDNVNYTCYMDEEDVDEFKKLLYTHVGARVKSEAGRNFSYDVQNLMVDEVGDSGDFRITVLPRPVREIYGEALKKLEREINEGAWVDPSIVDLMGKFHELKRYL